jgi:two-component system cell cycle response regulator
MNDQRTILALVAGGGALALGIAGAAADLPVLGAVAGGLAIIVAFLAVRSVQSGGENRAEAAKLAGQVSELENALAAQVQSRLGAEEAVRSLGAQLAAAQRDATTVPLTPVGVDSITDAVTGLFSEDYFRVAVDARIAAARRHLRPVAVVLLEVIEGLRSASPQVAQPMLVSETINATLREADTACRMIDGRFALVLEDTSENGAIWTIERIRRAIAELQKGLTLRAGIACYPAHAFGSTELLQRATEALVAARDWNQDRIEVASAD